MPHHLATSRACSRNRAAGASSAGRDPGRAVEQSDAAGAFDTTVAAVPRGQVRGGLPGDDHPRPGRLADDRQVGCGARIALETGCPVIPVGQWGARAACRRVREEAGSLPEAGADARQAAGGPRHSRANRTVAVIAQATERIMAAYGPRRGGAGASAPAERFRHEEGRGPSDRQQQSPGAIGPTATTGGEVRRDRRPRSRSSKRARARRSRSCSRTPATNVTGLGSARGGRRGHQRAAREHRVPAGIELPPQVSATHDVEKAAHGAGVVVLATPSQTLPQPHRLAPFLQQDAVLVVADEGRRELGTLDRMSQVIGEVTGCRPERIAVVSGPSSWPGDRPPRAGGLGGRLRRGGTWRGDCRCASTRRRSAVRARRPRVRAGAYRTSSRWSVGMAVGLGFGDNTTARSSPGGSLRPPGWRPRWARTR